MSEMNETRMDAAMRALDGNTDAAAMAEESLGLSMQDPIPAAVAPEDEDGPKGPDIDEDIGAIEDDDPPAVEGEEVPLVPPIPSAAPSEEPEDEIQQADEFQPQSSEQAAEQPQGASETIPEAEAAPEPQVKAKAQRGGRARRAEKAEPVTAGEQGQAAPAADPNSKMSAAGANGMTRAEVLHDARIREMERAVAREERERFLSGWSSLQTAMRRHLIVNGVVAGVEVREVVNPGGPSIDLVLLSVMVDGGYKVLVPFDEFYQDNPVDMQTVDLSTAAGRREYTRRRRALAEKLYELKIPMLITDMKMEEPDENGVFDYAIVASRRRALDIQEMQAFGKGRNGAPLIQEGDMHRATITSVSVYAVAVVLGGVDVRIPMRLLTYRYLLDARTKYRVGETLWVYVRSIKELENGHHQMILDARMMELQAARMKQKLLPIGSSTLGVITSVRHVAPSERHPEGSLNITAYLKMYDMPAVVRGLPVSYLGREPISGDELRLIVRGYSRFGFVVADCHAFNGAPGLLNH